MRKKIVLVILILLCCCYLSDMSSEDEIKMIFNEDDSFYDYSEYLLDLSSLDINTNNVLDYFNGMIISIYPYINPIYEDLIDVQKFVFNDSITDEKNIENFIAYYKMYLSKNALTSEIEKITFNGIKINKIKIYVDNSHLNNLLEIFPNIKILNSK
jgi:hypothetical protein